MLTHPTILQQNVNDIQGHYITEADIQKALTKYPYPQGLQLPKGSDVETVEQLFSNKQLAQLGLLKSIIKKEKNKNIRDPLMLMFSGLLTKANLTYHLSTYVL